MRTRTAFVFEERLSREMFRWTFQSGSSGIVQNGVRITAATLGVADDQSLVKLVVCACSCVRVRLSLCVCTLERHKINYMVN